MTYNLTILWNTYILHLAKQFLHSVLQKDKFKPEEQTEEHFVLSENEK